MSNKSIVTVGPRHSAKAYVDRDTGKPTASPPAVMFANHRYFETDDHQLGHEIDGKLVATVPPEGMADYAEHWPDCKDLVAQLAGKRAAKPASDARPEDYHGEQSAIAADKTPAAAKPAKTAKTKKH